MGTKTKKRSSRVVNRIILLGAAMVAIAFRTPAQPGTGTALNFDGAYDYVRVPAFLSLAPTTETTVGFWQIVNTAKNRDTFATIAFVSTNVFNAHVPFSDGKVYWDFGNINTSGRLSYTPPVPLVGAGWQNSPAKAIPHARQKNLRNFRNEIPATLRYRVDPMNYDAINRPDF